MSLFQQHFLALEEATPRIGDLSETQRRELFSSASTPQSVYKNRYPDILPFEHSRVHLSSIPSREGSDYINANWIFGHSYISCQAPIFSTFADHWRMVWETHSPITIMLTRIFEAGRTKAHIYWPLSQDTLVFGEITVTKLEEEDNGNFVLRRFLLSKGNEAREVYHLHFTGWPDFGVPQSTHGILELVSTVNNLQAEMGEGPLIVHCSAGVGRSASFIAIHQAVHTLENTGTLPDISEIVLQMRKERMAMVQTEKQFEFIHRVLNDFQPEENTSVKAPENPPSPEWKHGRSWKILPFSVIGSA